MSASPSMAPMSLELVFFNDPGHGWVQVTKQTAKLVLGEEYKRITHYSYQDHAHVFLEEDCDAPLFFTACHEKQISIKLKNQYSESSPIRDLTPFRSSFKTTTDEA